MPGRRIPEPSLLRTHPLTEERIVRLLDLKPAIYSAELSLISEPIFDVHEAFSRPVVRPPRWHISGLWH